MKRTIHILLASLAAVVLLGLVVRVTHAVLPDNGTCDRTIQEHLQGESSSIGSPTSWSTNRTAEVSITNNGSTGACPRVLDSPLFGYISSADIVGQRHFGIRNAGLNFTAFRHFHQRHYYIYDLRRIRV